MYTFAETGSLQSGEKGGEGEERRGMGEAARGEIELAFPILPKRRDCRGRGLICEAAIPDLAGLTSSLL